MAEQKISLFAAVLMNINIMVGAGIYIGPMIMAQHAGNASFLGWPISALLFIPIVWSIGQVAKLFPGQGSFYNYSKQGLGQTAGFVSGWLYFLGYASIGSLQVIGLREVMVNQFSISWVAHYPILFNIIFILALALLNMFNLAVVARIQSSATIFKLIPILFVLCIFAFYYNPNLQVFAPDTLSKLKITIPVALFGFWGFECCCSISHLIKGDKRNAYRAILIGFFATVAIYTIFHLGIIHIMGTENLTREGVAGFVRHLHFQSPLFSAALNSLIFSSIAVAYTSAIYGGFIANSCLIHAMAQEDMIFFAKPLTRTNRYARPWVTVLLHGLMIFAFTTIINYKDALNAMSNLGILSAFFLTFASLLVVQRRMGSYVNAGITMLAFACTFLLVSYSWELIGDTEIARFMNTLPLLVASIAGIVMFVIKDGRKRRRLAQSIKP